MRELVISWVPVVVGILVIMFAGTVIVKLFGRVAEVEKISKKREYHENKDEDFDD